MIKKLISFLMIVCLSVTARADNIDVAQSHKEVSAEAEGNYPALHRESSIPLASLQRAWDRAEPGAGVRIVNFDPRDTVRLVVREYMTTTIVFPQWERIEIEDVIVGDEGNYQVLTPKDNILTIRPVNYVGIDTSITIIGESGHVYGFYVRVEGHNSKNISDITVRMQVPEPIYANAKQSKQTNSVQREKDDYLEETHFDSSKLDFKFSMSGDESIAPVLVYSDGVRTWFDYGDNLNKRNLPTFFSVVDGYQKAINVTLDGSRLVAHSAGSFVLKSGNKITCVYPTKTKGKHS